jgi:hypothetical protein
MGDASATDGASMERGDGKPALVAGIRLPFYTEVIFMKSPITFMYGALGIAVAIAVALIIFG